MPLVFSALTPHPPLAFPSIGKENFSTLVKTRQSLERLAQDFHAAQPEALILLTPHGDGVAETVVAEVGERLHGDLRQFGDLTTTIDVPGAGALALQLRERARKFDVPLLLQTPESLDYGTTIPLCFLWNGSRPIPVLPIRVPPLSVKTLTALGQLLSEECHEHRERIALIASGDLSHCLTSSAPAGERPEGKIFDTRLLKQIQQKHFDSVMKFDPQLVDQALTCGYGVIVTLLAALAQRPVKPELLSYEGPFGVGYAVINFVLP